MMESSPALATTSAVLPRFPAVRIARKGLIALGIKLFAAGLALALQVCLARTLGHAGYGEFAYVFAWLQLMLVFAHGGFATAALKYVAQYCACSEVSLARGFITRSSQIVFVESIVLALIMIGGALTVHTSFESGHLRNFLIAGCTLPLLSQFVLNSAIVRGLGHVIASLLVSLAQPLLFLVAILVGTLLFRHQISASEALLMNCCAAVGALAAVLALQRRLQGDLREVAKRNYLTREWLGVATQMMLASGLMFLQGRTGVIFTGMLLDESQAGTYAAIERLADAALIGLVSVNALVAPKFAVLHAQQRRTELQKYARLAAWGATGFMIVVVVPLAIFGKPILRCFGEGFVTGYPVLLVLLAGVAVNAMCGSVGFLLTMTGHQKALLGILGAGLVVNVALSFLLVPSFGILGSALANTVALLFWNACMLCAVRVRLQIWPNIGRMATNTIF